MSGILIFTWDGGGNVPPTLGLADALIGRGHEVRVIGHPQQAEAVRAHGIAFEAYSSVPPWDPARRRSPLGFVAAYPRLFTDRRFGDEVRRAVDVHRPDAIVVDVLLPAGMAAAVAAGIPTVVLLHTVPQFLPSFTRGPVGLLAALKGFPFGRSLRAADALVVASPPALASGTLPPNAHVVGPIFGPGEPRAEADPSGRRILISLSTIDYPGMRGVLQRIVDAVSDLSDDIVVTTGGSIDPDDVRAPAHVVVRRSIPHATVLDECALVIGHGGHGTATKALTAGVPLVVRRASPLGDQAIVAAALEQAGVGVRLHPRDSADAIRRVVATALNDPNLHARARALGATLRSADGAARAADVVERAIHGLRPASARHGRS